MKIQEQETAIKPNQHDQPNAEKEFSEVSQKQRKDEMSGKHEESYGVRTGGHGVVSAASILPALIGAVILWSTAAPAQTPIPDRYIVALKASAATPVVFQQQHHN